MVPILNIKNMSVDDRKKIFNGFNIKRSEPNTITLRLQSAHFHRSEQGR